MVKSPAVTKNYTPQQIDFAMRYYLPTSATYGNAYASAKAAKYSETYSKNITDADIKWIEKILLDIIGKPTEKKNLIVKAKKVLDRSLDSPDPKISQDTAKFIAKTTEEFSEKQDMTSGGKPLNIAMVEFADGSTGTDS